MHARVFRRGLAALIALGMLVVLAACSTATVATPSTTVTETVTVAPGPGATGAPGVTDAVSVPSQATTDLPTVTVAELPAEAIQVLALIEAGGPYEYSQDGQTFQNREGILPPAPYGSYAEYTVETPGSSDRGARRLVVSTGGAVFYTSDHYQSFREVIR